MARSSPGAGGRQATWLVAILFHVRGGKSSIDRWIDTVAEDLPSGDIGVRLPTFADSLPNQAVRSAGSFRLLVRSS